jgi:hypothetical protein
MIQRFLAGMVLLCMGHSVFSEQIPVTTGALVAENFYFEHISQFRKVERASIIAGEYFTLGDPGSPAIYIFNLLPDGWVMVSADDAVIPVLAYSFEGRYDPGNVPPAFRAWVKQYTDQISYAANVKLPPRPDVAAKWRHLKSTDPSALVPLGGKQAVLPLITSRWDQGNYYNEMCPVAQGGPGGHAWAGCVPTCMGQIMYYYRWPETGTGSYSYYDPNYGTLSADFGATTYEWSGMPNSLTSSNHPVSELLYHLGVSCDLVYGAGGSGMYNHKAAYSLRSYFKYSPETQYVFRDSTTMNWDSILVAHLERSMPLYYAGWSDPNVSGHAFVCDGYQDSSYFHFNFGWSGSSDGYYYTSLLYPGGNNFTLAQEVIINCYPDTLQYTYPAYCSGESILSYKTGSLEDGSGRMKDYLPNTSCSWLIDPQNKEDSVTSITLNFDLFETSPDDLVRIYDGPSDTSPLLGSFTGQTLPETIQSEGNKMFISFTSGAGPTAPGWLATYTTSSPVWCGGTTILVADTAELTDGSLGFNYRNNSNCRWKISTPDEKPFAIYFRRFDTEPGKDFLRIFDLVSLDTLAEISGHFPEGAPPDSVVVPGGKAYLIFSTNPSVTGKGWEIYYPASHVGLNEDPSRVSVQLIPNPAASQVTIKWASPAAEITRISIYNPQGIECYCSPAGTTRDPASCSIDLNGFPGGIYVVRITTREEEIIKTLIIKP